MTEALLPRAYSFPLKTCGLVLASTDSHLFSALIGQVARTSGDGIYQTISSQRESHTMRVICMYSLGSRNRCLR